MVDGVAVPEMRELLWELVGLYGELSEQWTSEGSYEFALVEGRYLIDPWARNMAEVRFQIFYDLGKPHHWDAVLEIYGDPVYWRDMNTTAPEPIAA